MSQKIRYFVIDDGRAPAVYYIRLGGGRCDSGHLIVLREQHGLREADISHACYCCFHYVFLSDHRREAGLFTLGGVKHKLYLHAEALIQAQELFLCREVGIPAQ